MAKYIATFYNTLYYTVEIEAEDEGSAYDEAYASNYPKITLENGYDMDASAWSVELEED